MSQQIGECGAGVRRRNVTCRQPNGMAVSDSYCLLTRSAELYEKNTNVTSHGYEFLEVKTHFNHIFSFSINVF